MVRAASELTRRLERRRKTIVRLLRIAHAQRERIRELEEELSLTDKILASRQQVLDAIPECPAHGGGCVPHALEWIEKAKAQLAAGAAMERVPDEVLEAIAVITDYYDGAWYNYDNAPSCQPVDLIRTWLESRPLRSPPPARARRRADDYMAEVVSSSNDCL